MKHKVSEMEGALLDAVVARAAGESVVMRRGHPAFESTFDPEGPAHEWCERSWKMWLRFSPSTDWAQGGPIIERERISVSASMDGCGWYAEVLVDAGGGDLDYLPEQRGPTPLIAAMRAYVASKFGEEVELP